MRRGLTVAVVLSGLALAGFLTQPDWQATADGLTMLTTAGRMPRQPSDREISGRATVIDGDTLALDGIGQRVRLYGIDAPERSQTCWAASGARMQCGGQAAAALTALVGRNGLVACQVLDKDRYGRLVGECRTQTGVNLNLAMVRSGWAIEYVRYSDGRYATAELDAQSAGRGLWAGRFDKPWAYRKAHGS